jgi:hypothetical protein
MLNFTQQRLNDIVSKANLRPQQTIKQMVSKGTDPMADRVPVFDLSGQDIDESMERQQDELDILSGLYASQVQERDDMAATRFRETLGPDYPEWPATYEARRDSISAASSSGITRAPPTTAALASVDTRSIAGETPITPWRTKPLPKRRPGRPSNEDREARKKQNSL